MPEAGGAAEDLPTLTSLRFFAAILIVLLHLKAYYLWPWLQPIGEGAIQGVSFFFVLSGFILSHVYRGRRIGYGRFMRLRAARIWPIHLVALAAIVALKADDAFWAEEWTWDGRRLGLLLQASLLQSLSPHLWFQWNAPSWSISTELFFYSVFPLLVLGGDRRWIWVLPLTALPPLVLGFGWLPVGGDGPAWVYVSPFGRLLEFCLGMAAHAAWRRRAGWLARWATLAQLAALALLVIWLGWFAPRLVGALRPWLTASFYAKASGSALPFAVIIVVLAGGRGWLGRALGTPPLVWLGRISFALYLLHYPVVVLLPRIVPWHQDWTVLPILIGTAALAHHAVEEPARRWLAGRRVPPSVRTGPDAGCLTLGGAGG